MPEFFLDYVIFFKLDDDYQAAITAVGSNFLKDSPRAAANRFGIPFPYPIGNMSDPGLLKGIFFLYPYIPGQTIEVPDPTGLTYNDNLSSVVVPVQPGNPNGTFFEPVPSIILSWVGNIVKVPQVQHAGRITQRRWSGGKELIGIYEGGSGIDYNNFNRDSSRTIDGHGFGIRGDAASNVWNRQLNEYRTNLTIQTSWERIYFRFRRLPSTTDTGLWRCHGSVSPNTGVALKYRTGGGVDAYTINPTNVQTNRGQVFVPILNDWYRVDIFIKYGNQLGNTGRVRIYVNGALSFSYDDPGVIDLGFGNIHISSDAGQWTSPLDPEVEVDIDDWINSDLPDNMDPLTLDFTSENFPVDWQSGSHVRSHFARTTAQAAGLGVPGTPWSPPASVKEIVNQFPSPLLGVTSNSLFANQPTSIIIALSDAFNQSIWETVNPPLGAVSGLVFALISANFGTGLQGQLGYAVRNLFPILIPVNVPTALTPTTIAYQPTGMIRPDEIFPWNLVYISPNEVANYALASLISVVEYLGLWGKEDDPSFDFPISRLTNIHNCRWNNTVWGYVGSPPVPDVFAVAGNYIGTGQYNEIALPGPCHFLIIRPVTTNPFIGKTPAFFFGSSHGSHLGATQRTLPQVRLFFDEGDNQFKFSCGGSGAPFAEEGTLNENGVTYHFTAFCDPGMRYNLCGAFRHGISSAVPKSNPLIVPDFTPQAGFFQVDDVGIVKSTGDGLWYKGTGHTGNAGSSPNSNTSLANLANFASGIINSFQGLHTNIGPANYSLWRTQDGGDGTNVMIQLTSYVGTASNPRTITLIPTSGRMPLLVMIFPTSGAGNSYMRDPSHTGIDCSRIKDNVIATDAIQGVDIDKIIVSSALNVVGVTYSVFAICGGLTNINGVYHPTYHAPSNILPFVLPTPPGGLDRSGIYFINQNKASTHDSYNNNIEVKIPDPTIRTALLGE